MAKVIVSGIIDAIDEYAQGSKSIIRLQEEYQANNGETWRRKWTLWCDLKHVDLAKGDWLEIEGDLSTKVSEWTNKEGQLKQIIDHNVNSPVIVKHRGIFGDVQEPTRDLDDERKYRNVPF
jgi:hypothetical protein